MKNGNALKLLNYGVYLLGSGKEGDRHSMVASWVSQVSSEPRRVAVGVKKTRHSHDLIHDGGVFSLCVLDERYKSELERFKSAGGDGFDFETKETGAPILKDCVGYVECRVVQEVDAGDHTLFIGDVVAEGVNGGTPMTSGDIHSHYYGG